MSSSVDPVLRSIAPADAASRSALPAVERDRLIYRPASWFEPLNLDAIFESQGPLEVELGSGDGSFLLAWAAAHPERRFLGVERLLGRIRKLDRKAQRAGLTNLRGLRIEASYFLEYLLPPGCAEALHLYFPDPWPKRRHHKNRLVSESFVALTRRVLKPGACIHLRTDNTDYFTVMLAVFRAAPAWFREVPTPPGLASVLTDFEQEFLKAGIPTSRASFERLPDV